MRAYFKFFHNYAAALEELTDEEVGRLVRALLIYSETGERVDLQGNERFIFPMIANNINADANAYDVKCQKAKESIEKRWHPTVQTNTNVFDGIQTNTNVYESYQEKEKEKEKEEEKDNRGKTKRFSPPTLEDLQSYCSERRNNVDPRRFYDFYQAKGWMVGKNKMKDWKACVRTWEQRNKAEGKGKASYNLSELDRLGLEIPEL